MVESLSNGGVVRLELENFKSYRGHVTIGPFSDFTCIIGPNGSGKSNTMDAVSFVLGIRAAHLRGHNLKDLIYSVEGEKAEKKASVTLVFRTKEGREIIFKRTIKAEGSSEYRIDDVVKSWEQYDEVLQGFKILTKAKNFLVFQGDIQKVASKDPKDLTSLLEVVSGSEEFKAEYEEKKKKKEETTARMLDVSSKRRGVGAEKNQYKMQKKEAERFKVLKAEQESLKKNHALFKLFYIENNLNTMKKDLLAARRKLNDLKEHNSEGAKEYERCKKEYAELYKKSMTLNKSKGDKLMKQNQLQRQCDKLGMEIKNAENKLAEAQNQIKSTKIASKQHQENVAMLRKQLANVTADKEAWEKKNSKEKAEVEDQALTESQYQEWKQLKQKATTRTVTMAQEISNLKRAKNAELMQVKSLATQVEQLEGRKKQLTDAISQIQERKTKFKDDAKKHDEELKATKAEQADVKAKLNERMVKKEKIDEALSQLSLELSDLRFDKQDNQRDKKFAETLEQMKNLFSGVKGKVHELCRIPDKKYQTAVTVAMGKNMEAIVVNNSQTAMECITFLKDQRMAPMTFLPLESIKASHVDERLRTLGGTCKPVLDCIQYDPSVETAIRYAVGACLVCDKMHEAKQVAFGEIDGHRHKVVTTDGSCIQKNGCIQGGQATMERKAKRWDEHKYTEKKRQRDELVQQWDELGDVTTLRNRELDLNGKVLVLQALKETNVGDSLAADRKLETSNRELDTVSKQLKELVPKSTDAKKRVQTQEDKIAELESKKAHVEKEIFAAFEKTVKITDVQEYEEKRDRLLAETARKGSEYKELISRVENQLEYAERKAGGKELKAAEKLASDLEAKLVKLRAEQTTATKDFQASSKDGEDSKNEAEACNSKMTKLDQRQKELKKALGSKLDDIGAAKKKVTSQESACEKLRSLRLSTLKKCGVEEIQLPSVPLSAKRKAEVEGRRKRRKTDDGAVEDEDEEVADVEKLDVSEAISMTEDPSASQGGSQAAAGAADVICIDFSGLPSTLRKLASNSKDYDRQNSALEEQIQKLEMDIDKLAPNLKAMQRLADVEEKFDDTTKEFEDCREAQKKAQLEFETVADKRNQKFMDTFDLIAGEIDHVYKVLTKSDDAPAGGTAYISLDNPLEPYNGGIKYNAMPPTKRFMKMEVLSGGEQTMAAMALLITVHRVKPSPFFIMDEIDAHLDPGNVMRVLRFVQAYSQKCQFIVISLKPEFFGNAKSLCGIYKDTASNGSKVLTWDLTQHDNGDDEAGGMEEEEEEEADS
jgi:structural maintenance of chromosome 1